MWSRPHSAGDPAHLVWEEKGPVRGPLQGDYVALGLALPHLPVSPWVLYASTATVRWISRGWALGAELTE